MTTWYGDVSFMDQDISIEEVVAARWEQGMEELMAEDWEVIMGGPEDAELASALASVEEAFPLDTDEEVMLMAGAADEEWELPFEARDWKAAGDHQGSPDTPHTEGVSFVDEDDIPF